MGYTFDDIEVRLGDRVLGGASEHDLPIQSLSIARKPSTRVEMFTLMLNGERAEAVRAIGVGGICRLFGSVDGGKVRQAAKIEAIEPPPPRGRSEGFLRLGARADRTGVAG